MLAITSDCLWDNIVMASPYAPSLLIPFLHSHCSVP